MKKFQPGFTAAVLAFTIVSCHPSAPNNLTIGDYTRKSELNGDVRSGAVTFTIGDTAYVGLGYNGIKRLNDFWGYNANTDSWAQEANFPGVARSYAVAFAIGPNGYVGTGYDGINLYNDFWRYNQASGSWDSIAAFPGTPRRGAVAWGLGNFGYVSTGYDNSYKKDFWKYDPSAGPMGKWTEKTSSGCEKRSGAIAFVHGTKAYLVTGTNNGTPCGDFWYFDTVLDQWVQLRNIYDSNTSETYDDNYTNIERDNGVGFVIGDSAFITTGENGGLVQATWGYDFAMDQWVQRSPFQGSPRQSAVAFALNGYGYICAGQDNTNWFDDLILFNPNKTLNTVDF
jgi:N-acetylneuraminic acid mutarotase